MAGSQRATDASVSKPWTIVGQGLAGTCLAWELWDHGITFRILDREKGGSSRVAAGLINPVTGKNFEPTPGIAALLPEATTFYQKLESRLQTRLWHPLPILRLAQDDKEWRKMLAKCQRPDIACWLADAQPLEATGWLGALELRGGGRLDTRAFLDTSRGFFLRHGIYEHKEVPPGAHGNLIWCDGAAGLITGRHGPHRCAKGEILTILAPHWNQTHIRIGAGGWLVPLGDGSFKAGATYQWDPLDECPTAAGREKVSTIAHRLGGDGNFEITAHQAGIRPILRRSEPAIGQLDDGSWFINGLGSKGSLTAPTIARLLAEQLKKSAE